MRRSAGSKPKFSLRPPGGAAEKNGQPRRALNCHSSYGKGAQLCHAHSGTGTKRTEAGLPVVLPFMQPGLYQPPQSPTTEGGADCGGIGLGDNEYPDRMVARTADRQAGVHCPCDAAKYLAGDSAASWYR
jgi:hypothetical protein